MRFHAFTETRPLDALVRTQTAQKHVFLCFCIHSFTLTQKIVFTDLRPYQQMTPNAWEGQGGHPLKPLRKPQTHP